MKVIGYKQSNFRAKDGTAVEGYNIYCTYPFNSPIADGEACERLYISDKRLNDCGYVPCVGDEVEVMYNRFGKVASIKIAGAKM